MLEHNRAVGDCNQGLALVTMVSLNTKNPGV